MTRRNPIFSISRAGRGACAGTIRTSPERPTSTRARCSINAFPKDDTIPQKVCSKLGSGGDSTELDGPGNYYLKIEASGGSWELAVEDFR